MITSTQVAVAGTGVERPTLNPRTRDKIIYWGSTALLTAVMVYSIVMFTFFDHFPAWDPHGPSAFAHLGLPGYFKAELTIAKMLGVLALWVPGVPSKLREFAYFGFGLTLISAVIAHGAMGDASITPLFIVDPLVFFGLLVTSYWFAPRVRLHAR